MRNFTVIIVLLVLSLIFRHIFPFLDLYVCLLFVLLIKRHKLLPDIPLVIITLLFSLFAGPIAAISIATVIALLIYDLLLQLIRNNTWITYIAGVISISTCFIVEQILLQLRAAGTISGINFMSLLVYIFVTSLVGLLCVMMYARYYEAKILSRS